MKRPIIEFHSSGESGNIYHILALVRKEFQKQHRITEYNELYERVTDSHSYVEALDVIRVKCELIDLNGKY